MAQLTGRRMSAPRPAAGGAALVRRKRRWPNFIIWRWAGRALGGWIPCLRRAVLPLLHPAHSISKNLPPPGRKARRPAGSRRRDPPSEQPGNPPEPAERPHGKPAGLPDVRPVRPRERVAGRLGRVQAEGRPGARPARPLAKVVGLPGRRPARRGARPGKPLGRDVGQPGGRPGVRAAKGVLSDQPRPSSPASAAAQLINAIWVKAWGKFPRNSPVTGSISSE